MTKHQVVVVTVPTFEEQDPRDYGRCLGNLWGIGRKGINDGVIVLLAAKDRKIRIAVGEGLRAALTDDEARTIIERDMVSAFRAGRFGPGVEAAIGSIGREIGPNG